jgi:hypothetical protein
MSASDHEYFIQRAGEERVAAERAATTEAQRSHLELAQRYEVAAAAAKGLRPELTIMQGGKKSLANGSAFEN